MALKAPVTFVTIVLAFSMIGCLPHPQEVACRPDNLLLKTSSFPGNIWQEIGSRDRRDAPSRLGLERAGTSFSTQSQGVAIQVFYRFATLDDAEQNYPELEHDWFNLAPKGSTWLSPNELKNTHLRADKYRLDCSQDVIETCRLVARYQTYVVEFKVDMPALTDADFIRLLRDIDQKMISCVDK